MRNKEGFTLIELLAVIVILAVIALIATPLIMGTIEKAKVNAYKDTIYGILKSAENYVAEELLKEDYQGETLDLSTETKLNYKGTKPNEGGLDVLSNGNMALYAKNGKYCYIKRRNTNEIEVIENAKECSLRVAKNLYKNGYGEYGDNTNFSQFTYQDGYFRVTVKGDVRPSMDKKATIDPKKKYHLSVQAKSGIVLDNNYLGIIEFDVDGNEIYAHHSMFQAGTTTKLVRDLKRGDTTVYLENANGFVGYEDSNYKSYNGFIIWNYKDSTGYTYPSETYSRNTYSNMFDKSGLDKANNVIRLNKPWNDSDVKSGTELSQINYAGTYNYGLLSNGTLGTSFQKYERTISGTNSAGITNNEFRYGTSAIKFMTILSNLNTTSNTYVDFKEVVLEEVE